MQPSKELAKEQAKKQLEQPEDYLRQTFDESILIKKKFLEDYGPVLIEVADLLGQSFRKGGKLLIMGNGGSAADAQHMAAEMVGRMLVERRPLPALALTTDTSNLTAIGNDYGYDQVFLRQVEALAREGDVVLAISTSGNSPNILLAAEKARSIGCKVVGLTGRSGGRLKDLCDYFLCAAVGENSSRIQETHIFAVHSMVDLLDRFFLEEEGSH